MIQQLIQSQPVNSLCLQGLAIVLLSAAWMMKRRRSGRVFRWKQLAMFAAMRGVAKWLDTVAEHLRHATLHDVLTKLPNRMLFVEFVARAVEQNQQSHRFAIMYLDLDRFKIVNDSLGHHAGDELLIEVGRRLRAIAEGLEFEVRGVRRVDVARLCSDEFGVVLHGLEPDTNVLSIGQHLLRRLSEPFNLNGLTVHTSASIGILAGDVATRDPEDLIRAADTAMYRAKESGGGRCVVYDHQMQSQAVVRLQLENDLCQAIKKGEFRVFFQPIVLLESGRVEGFEALVRWQHPTHGMIAPDRFIPVAEETGLIVPIGMFVLHESLRQLAELHQQFPNRSDLSVSVNLSKRQLIEEGLVETIAGALSQSGVARHLLKLEVTESVVMQHAEDITPVLLRLKSLGVRLVMDDFGTGHSSLSCLHEFPVDCLKIDRAFINTMGLNRQYAAIVHAIVTLAHNLGMVVVAEGIESAEQLVLLQSLECGFGQGYFFSKPVPGSALATMLAADTVAKKAG